MPQEDQRAGEVRPEQWSELGSTGPCGGEALTPAPWSNGETSGPDMKTV